MSVEDIGDPNAAVTQKLKLVICGDSRTGKTKIVDRIVSDNYSEQYLETIGSGHETVTRLVPGANVDLDLWDTGGNPKYRIVLPIYFRNVDIVLVCYDVTNRASFDNIPYYLTNAPIWAETTDLTIAIVGSKIDSWKKKREVTFEMAQEVCQAFKVKIFEVSALTTQGIEEMLQKLLRSALKRKKMLPRWMLGSKASEDGFVDEEGEYEDTDNV